MNWRFLSSADRFISNLDKSSQDPLWIADGIDRKRNNQVLLMYFVRLHSLDPTYTQIELNWCVWLEGVESATFTFINKCSYTVWPGILSSAGVPQPSTTGFALLSGQSNALSVPATWSGRMWGRTLCSEDPTTGKFTCLTGDCGSGAVQCSGAGAIPPATLAEFTLDGAGGLDFYDVSLVDGYNLPMSVAPKNGKAGNCTVTGCATDLNGPCPLELTVIGSGGSGGGGHCIACKSACEAFGDPRYCCSGAYGSPNTCKPTIYSELFKSACPRAYSYAYDDATSTFTCASADYTITFCPFPSTR